MSNPVLEAITSRRTVREFTGRAIPRNMLEKWLDAARWAPNHRLTEPWRFVVLEHGGSARREVAAQFRRYAFDTSPELPEPKRSQTADGSFLEVHDAPAFLYAYSIPDESEEVTRENYAACACAVQNLALAAHADGFALGWSTGRVTRLPGLATLVEADPAWEMVGALFIGEPRRKPRAQRQPMEHSVTWL
jgi:nitroreductase